LSAASIQRATPRSAWSLARRPTSWVAKGSPSALKPVGRVIAGTPKSDQGAWKVRSPVVSGVGATFGLDLAGLYRIPAARLNLGLNVQNLGPSVTFINEDERSPLSRNIKVGAAWEAWNQDGFKVLAAGDFDQSLVTSSFYQLHGGVELRYTDQIAGRVGYYYDPLGQLEGLTYGLGLGWKGLSLDFGSIPQAKDSGLPNVSKITLGYRF